MCVLCVPCAVLKAGERMLTTKINTQVIILIYCHFFDNVYTCTHMCVHVQQKRLHTVLHAMEDHRRRQSQLFKFEAPDSVVCM